MAGTLYLCGTPIGNLGDITLRVLETLKSVDMIACEDTRKTLQLLNHFDIQKPVTSYYEHNKFTKGDQIMDLLEEGKDIALVSDAGMPGISDPGYDLVQQCLERGVPFTVLPGPVAAITGLVLSGIATDRFTFEGFLPREKKERKAVLEALVQEPRTIIFYESPHRLKDSLAAIDAIFGDRHMAVARELTKKFEDVRRGTAKELAKSFEETGIKGEFVLIIEGATIVEEEKGLDWAVARVAELVEEGVSQKDAIKQAAKEAGVIKRDLYNLIVKG